MNATALDRIVSSAIALGTNARAADSFLRKRILLTGDIRALSAPNGCTCFETSLYLLMRTCSCVNIVVPPTHRGWAASLVAQLQGHPLEENLRWLDDIPSILDRFDAVLHIGDTPAPYENLTTVHSDGWVVRLASDAPPIKMSAEKSNALGAIGAAAFGVTEIFKRLVDVRPERGPMHTSLEFSLWTYSTEHLDTGPVLPNSLEVSILIAGLGAIGSAVSYILKRLPLSGILWLVDPQSYVIENVGTSIALNQQGLQQSKVQFAASYLRPQFDVASHPYDLQEVKTAYFESRTRPRVLIGALDSIQSRYDLQDYWADLVLDAAISESFACQVFRWRYGEGSGCLRCQFVEPEIDAVTTAVAATGISRDRISDPNAVVTQADVDAAPELHRNRLATVLGRPICSVVSAAVIDQLSGSKSTERASPSVPFVAVLSAVMVMSELIKEHMPGALILKNCFHFDALYGPAAGFELTSRRRPECKCSAGTHAIERYRSMRDSFPE